MKKLITLAATVVTFMLAVAFFTISMESKAGVFSDIKDAVSGHVSDIKDRLTTEESTIKGFTFATGKIREDDVGQDSAHYAKGTVSIVKADDGFYIQLESDFEAGFAPDLYVYSAIGNPLIVDEVTFAKANTTELGKLKLGKGASYYKIPEGTDLTQVVIWCKRFSQFMGATVLLN